MGHQLFSSELPKIYEFRVEADGPFGRVDSLIYTVDLEALRDSALETDSVEWSTHQIAKHLKRSADAQEEQSRSVEALSSEVRKRLGRQSSEQASGVEVPEVVEPALSEISMRPLSDDDGPA
ncbi:hypothetical protein [Streptomyces cinnamoneus]|nr:hypothetical protein [Streptomyces cinnamoneus]